MKSLAERKKSKEFIQGYIEFLEFKDPKKGEVNKLSKYKAIFAKSFFNVEEKPITNEEKKLYAELSEIAEYEIAPTPELDYSQAKIPNSKEEYKEAYARARKAVETEFDNYFRNSNQEKINNAKDKTITASKNSLLDFFNQIDENIGNKLRIFDNDAVFARRASEQDANKFRELELAGVVSDLSARSERVALLGAENQPQSQKGTPSTSPGEPKASCLSGMLKAIANIKTPQFLQSIFGKLRSNSGDSKGGGGR